MRHHPRPRCYYQRVVENTALRIRQHRYEPVDLDTILSNHERFIRDYPAPVTPVYSVGGRDCSADVDFVRAVSSSSGGEEGEEGVGFSCRTIEGLRLVTSAAPLEDTVPRILYSSPCKSRKQIAEAVSICGGGAGSRSRRLLITAESVAEVVRIGSVSTTAIELVLRISPVEEVEEESFVAAKKQHRPAGSGATRNKWKSMLGVAKAKGMVVSGISFGLDDDECDDCTTSSEQEQRLAVALKRAREAFDLARSDEFGFDVKVVDVGTALILPTDGGVDRRLTHRCLTVAEAEEDADDEQDEDEDTDACSDDDDSSGSVKVDSAGELLRKYFPPRDGVSILAEPARYALPDEAVAVKWWGTPKVRRSAPSLYAYLTRRGGDAASVRVHRGGYGCGYGHQHHHRSYSLHAPAGRIAGATEAAAAAAAAAGSLGHGPQEVAAAQA